MPFTVRIDPVANSQQASIIPNAGENNDGVMSKQDKRKLDSLPSGPLPSGGVSSVSGTLPIVATAGANPVVSINPATDATAGSLSAADKTKLDSLPSGPLPGPGQLDFAMFYGLTTGTGNAGPNDYAGTIAVRTTNGTGNVPFPRTGPAKGGTGITALSGTTFQLAAVGTYKVSFRCHTTEPGQLELVLNNALLPETCFTNMNPTSGGHPIVGVAYVTTVAVNSVLEVVNPNGNSTPLTITPADGAETNANAQVLTIEQLS